MIRARPSELGLTSVVVTHDLASAYMLSDRIAMLARHRIVEIAPVATFRASTVPEVRSFVDAMPTVAGAAAARSRVASARPGDGEPWRAAVSQQVRS